MSRFSSDPSRDRPDWPGLLYFVALLLLLSLSPILLDVYSQWSGR